MPLILANHPPMLEQLTKTEVVLDNLKGVLDKNGAIKSYLNNEKIRAYTPESAYEAFLQNKLDDLVVRLTKEVIHASSANEVISNSNFKKIVSYGEVIAPAILASLSRRPSILVWALNQIFNMRISEKTLSIEQASIEWVKWGKVHRIAL